MSERSLAISAWILRLTFRPVGQGGCARFGVIVGRLVVQDDGYSGVSVLDCGRDREDVVVVGRLWALCGRTYPT